MKIDPTKRMVRFNQNCSPYTSGERASFREAEAGKLVSRGIAHYVKLGEDGSTWVRDEKEQKDANEQSNDVDGQGSGEGPEATGGAGSEGAAAAGATATPTKARSARRSRVKLD